MVEKFGNRNAFWQALIFTVIVFGFGIMMGFFIEDHRAKYVNSNLLDSEISLLDEQLTVNSIKDFNISCDANVENIFNFADKVYEDALELERYDGASTFSNQLIVLHKKYDLLRLTLWLEAIKIKKNCNSDFHIVTYLYEYKTEDVEKQAKQKYYSRILAQLKSENREEVLLIPIAANMNLSSVDLTLSQYNITEFPAIILNEERVITDFMSFEKINRIILMNV
ncbi:MAG: hypothetical protein AABW82_04465 [Nanoarchaeota archaeon]